MLPFVLFLAGFQPWRVQQPGPQRVEVPVRRFRAGDRHSYLVQISEGPREKITALMSEVVAVSYPETAQLELGLCLLGASGDSSGHGTSDLWTALVVYVYSSILSGAREGAVLQDGFRVKARFAVQPLPTFTERQTHLPEQTAEIRDGAVHVIRAVSVPFAGSTATFRIDAWLDRNGNPLSVLVHGQDRPSAVLFGSMVTIQETTQLDLTLTRLPSLVWLTR